MDTPCVLVSLPDGCKLVTEKPGTIKIIDNGNPVNQEIRATEHGTRGGDLLHLIKTRKELWLALCFSGQGIQ